jgi:hypothetical protein
VPDVLLAGTDELGSPFPSGSAGISHSLSRDGRFAVFFREPDGVAYVKDALAGTAGQLNSGKPVGVAVISADGTHVAYSALNPSGGTNINIGVTDLRTGGTKWIAGPDGVSPGEWRDVDGAGLVLSGNGSELLINGWYQGSRGIWRVDRAGSLTLMAMGDGPWSPQASDDFATITWRDDANGTDEMVILRDGLRKQIAYPAEHSLSGDGRFVVASQAVNDPLCYLCSRLVRTDLLTGQEVPVSKPKFGATGGFSPQLSYDGNLVAYGVTDDATLTWQVGVTRVDQGGCTAVASHFPNSTKLAQNTLANLGGSIAISGNGRSVMFDATDAFVPTDTNASVDAYIVTGTCVP